ncbi:hypothetical protein B0H16DRAFT_1745202 [Mycena metata]|uniref:Uncharacterized protein n=1 Tax=Mycena metata TaxID=1033252 RepID=A0AAD7H408_9AGAR|nr:hypothetical protein B0H16DRAFT_1745202 [Mycena metata]
MPLPVHGLLGYRIISLSARAPSPSAKDFISPLSSRLASGRDLEEPVFRRGGGPLGASRSGVAFVGGSTATTSTSADTCDDIRCRLASSVFDLVAFVFLSGVWRLRWNLETAALILSRALPFCSPRFFFVRASSLGFVALKTFAGAVPIAGTSALDFFLLLRVVPFALGPWPFPPPPKLGVSLLTAPPFSGWIPSLHWDARLCAGSDPEARACDCYYCVFRRFVSLSAIANGTSDTPAGQLKEYKCMLVQGLDLPFNNAPVFAGVVWAEYLLFLPRVFAPLWVAVAMTFTCGVMANIRIRVISIPELNNTNYLHPALCDLRTTLMSTEAEGGGF